MLCWVHIAKSVEIQRAVTLVLYEQQFFNTQVWQYKLVQICNLMKKSTVG
jgi:hypothetical protein